MNAAISRKLINRLVTAVVLALAFGAPAHSQQSKATAKQVTIEGVGVMELTTITASVEAVDLKNRIVTVKGPRGNAFAIPASERVKNLSQVKVGDMLELDYYESVAIEVKKVEGVPSLTETVGAAKAQQGKKPGALALRKVRVVTNVLGVNTETQSVLVRGPLGHLVQVKIGDPKVLASLNAGGQIDLTYVEGLAISVRAGASKT